MKGVGLILRQMALHRYIPAIHHIRIAYRSSKGTFSLWGAGASIVSVLSTRDKWVNLEGCDRLVMARIGCAQRRMQISAPLRGSVASGRTAAATAAIATAVRTTSTTVPPPPPYQGHHTGGCGMPTERYITEIGTATATAADSPHRI